MRSRSVCLYRLCTIPKFFSRPPLIGIWFASDFARQRNKAVAVGFESHGLEVILLEFSKTSLSVSWITLMDVLLLFLSHSKTEDAIHASCSHLALLPGCYGFTTRRCYWLKAPNYWCRVVSSSSFSAFRRPAMVFTIQSSPDISTGR